MSVEDAPSATGAAISVKSAARVLTIFEYFERTRSPRTLSEISTDLIYPVSSTLALLRSVQQMGYLTYDQNSKSYFPSIRFGMLGQWIHDRLFEQGAIIQMMDHLVAVTQETASLGIQNGLQSQHVHIVETPQSLSYNPKVGTLRPLLRSAVGKVLLSMQPTAVVLKTIDRINTLGADEGRHFDAKDIMSGLEQVRRDGYAYSANVFTPGAAIIAVALPRRASEVPMAIAISGPSSRVDEHAVPQLLQKINQAISDFLDAAPDEELGQD